MVSMDAYDDFVDRRTPPELDWSPSPGRPPHRPDRPDRHRGRPPHRPDRSWNPPARYGLDPAYRGYAPDPHFPNHPVWTDDPPKSESTFVESAKVGAGLGVGLFGVIALGGLLGAALRR